MDVRRLTAGRSIDAGAFLAEVRRVGAGPLAATPLTLDLLLHIYETSDHKFPARRADLFTAALPHLAIAEGKGYDGETFTAYCTVVNDLGGSGHWYRLTAHRGNITGYADQNYLFNDGELLHPC